MEMDDGRVPSGQALVNDAPTGHRPSGFDPSRIAEIVAAIEPKTLQPIIKRASDDFYEAMLTAVDYYLRENLEYNLGSHIQMLERENQRMRTELYEVDRTIGGIPLGHEGRLHAIALLDLGARNHTELLYQVSRKYDGETRHETALRYLRDRDRSGEADKTGTGLAEGKSPAPQGDAPNLFPHHPTRTPT